LILCAGAGAARKWWTGGVRELKWQAQRGCSVRPPEALGPRAAAAAMVRWRSTIARRRTSRYGARACRAAHTVIPWADATVAGFGAHEAAGTRPSADRLGPRAWTASAAGALCGSRGARRRRQFAAMAGRASRQSRFLFRRARDVSRRATRMAHGAMPVRLGPCGFRGRRVAAIECVRACRARKQRDAGVISRKYNAETAENRRSSFGSWACSAILR